MSSNTIHLAGVIRFVSFDAFNVLEFEGCLHASHLDKFGKVWCETKDKASWCMIDKDGNAVCRRDVSSYVLTVVSDLENVSIPEANARWKQFVRHARAAVPMTEFRVVTFCIE